MTGPALPADGLGRVMAMYDRGWRPERLAASGIVGWSRGGFWTTMNPAESASLRSVGILV